ncbi:hypothetical protein LTR37_020726 [Vermiconidia calcicola]|uniref:Uncharacterized protein n=1 Tax=Vermiconidia calcicola TaxID=1690605 RepID=A0ACC3MCA5_9PEZI|nr:hypothetical protein LTR37_020726 [Vermiconidia calcicola]
MAPCYLLMILREIRNMIYDNTSASPVISAPADLDSPTNPTVTLYNFTAISFLLPNRQIHDEYQDYKLPRARLLVNFKGNARLRYQCCRINTAISFKADFPMDILKHVSACEVWLNWFNVKDIPSPERLLLFAVALFQKTGSFSGSQESIAWTPIRALASYIRTQLLAQQLRPILSTAAKFKLRVGMDGFPDPEDLDQIGRLRLEFWVNLTAQMQCSLFDIRAFHSAFQPPSGVNGDYIGVDFLLETAASCTREDCVRVGSQILAILAGEIPDPEHGHIPVQVGLELDRPILVWSMRLAEEGEANYRGFVPELMIEDSR